MLVPRFRHTLHYEALLPEALAVSRHMSTQPVPIKLDNDALWGCQRNVKVSFIVVVAGETREKRELELQWDWAGERALE
jgi:hypothetical protein